MKKLFAFLLTIVMFTASLSGCSGGPAEAPSPSGTAPATSAGDADVAQTGSEPYKIGVFLRFNDEAGTRMRAVLEHYLESLNSQGGVNGHLIDAVYYDTEGDAAKTIDAFTRLVEEDKVLLAIGPTTSSCALAVIDLCAEYEIPVITPQATNTSITVDYGNEWFFRNSVADIYHSYTLCDYIVKEMGCEKIAIMHETGTLGLGQYENFVARMKDEYGMEPAIVQEWNEGDIDFKTQLLAVKNADVDCIVFAGHEAELAIIVSQRLDVGISPDIPICGFSSMSSSDFYGVAGESAVGAIFSTTFSPTDTREDIQAFVNEYSSVVNGTLDHNAAQAYDTIVLITEILGEVELGNTPDTLAADRTAIRDALANVSNWVGLTGVTTFGVSGDTDSRDGKKESSIYRLESDYTWSSLWAPEG
mgnify:FL=1